MDAPDELEPECTHEDRLSLHLCPAHGPFKCPDGRPRLWAVLGDSEEEQ